MLWIVRHVDATSSSLATEASLGSRVTLTRLVCFLKVDQQHQLWLLWASDIAFTSTALLQRGPSGRPATGGPVTEESRAMMASMRALRPETGGALA
jgi:hypothetical protein